MSNTPTTMAASLRAMHAAKTRHFVTDGGVEAFSIVATEARLDDLLRAAEALEEVASMRTVTSVTIDGAGLHLLTHDQVREASLVELTNYLEPGTDEPGDDHVVVQQALGNLCRRLGVEL